jgi:hypothetical protein
MRAWEIDHYFEDCDRACEVFGCGEWHEDNGKHGRPAL